MSNSAIRADFETLRDYQEMLEECDVPVRNRQGLIRKCRDSIKKHLAERIDPLEKPMTEEWRHLYCGELGEDGVDFAILPIENDKETAEDIIEYLEETVAYPPINSPYDCTGRRFTRNLTAKKTPAGWAVTHHWALDI